MNATISVVRAIGVEFLKRTLRPLILLVITVDVLLLAAGGWLVSRNPWWWLFESLLIIATLLIVAAAVALRLAIRLANPPQTSEQRQSVRAFVDKLQRTSEHLQTPQVMIVYRIVRDVVRPRADRESFISGLAHDSKTLAPDFLALQRMFGER